jgi:hypothetical protein
MVLDDYVADCMRQTGMRIGAGSAAIEVLRTALADDAALHASACTEVTAGTAVLMRDHISRWRVALLQSVLVP